MVMPVAALNWALSSSVGYGCAKSHSLSTLVDLLLCLNPAFPDLSDPDRSSCPCGWARGSMAIAAFPAVRSVARLKVS